MILPFNLRMGDVVLKYATAQLLTKIEENGNDHYFFFAPEGFMPEYTFDKSTVKSGNAFYTPEPGIKSTFTLTTKTGKKLKITTLTREQALHATKINNHILITRATVLPERINVPYCGWVRIVLTIFFILRAQAGNRRLPR